MKSFRFNSPLASKRNETRDSVPTVPTIPTWFGRWITRRRPLASCSSLGVRVEPNGPKLRVVSPDDLDPHNWSALVEGLAEFKAEILALLATPTSPVDRRPGTS